MRTQQKPDSSLALLCWMVGSRKRRTLRRPHLERLSRVNLSTWRDGFLQTAGTGAAGLVAAELGGDVTLTDQRSFVFPGDGHEAGGGGRAPMATRSLPELLQINADLNAGEGRRVSVHELLWGDRGLEARLPHATYDLIMGADIVSLGSMRTPTLQLYSLRMVLITFGLS